MISGGVEPQAAFVVGSIVGGNGSWPIVRCSASGVQPRAGRLRHVEHLTACHYVVVDHARIRHAGNLTPSAPVVNHCSVTGERRVRQGHQLGGLAFEADRMQVIRSQLPRVLHDQHGFGPRNKREQEQRARWLPTSGL